MTIRVKIEEALKAGSSLLVYRLIDKISEQYQWDYSSPWFCFNTDTSRVGISSTRTKKLLKQEKISFFLKRPWFLHSFNYMYPHSFYKERNSILMSHPKITRNMRKIAYRAIEDVFGQDTVMCEWEEDLD